MKKLSIISLFAALGLVAASCQKEVYAVYDADSVKAPELAKFEGQVLELGGKDIVVNFVPAEFGVQAPTGYTLEVTPKMAGAAAAELKSTIDAKEGIITFTQKDLNALMLNAGATAEVAFPCDFALVAFLKDDKGAVVNGTQKSSAVVSATYTPYEADLLDVDVYKHVWIIGAGQSIGAWGFDTIEQYLYDYEDKGVYTGLVDYQWDAAKGWKLTGVAGWSDDCNWGLDGGAPAPDAEASSIDIISDGGSSDIKAYSHRFYMWEFNRAGLKLNKKYGFDNIGVVGSLNGWNAADPAMKMQYNATTHKFFLDLDIPAGTELKFTCDDNWNLNFGVGCEQGGANIVPDVTGNVRVYLDLNKNEYEFNASKFGTQEEGTIWNPGEPQEYPSNMYMIGNFCGWNWDNAFEMTKINGSTAKFWTLAYLVAGEGFKFCDQKAWSGDFCELDTNIGFDVDGGNCVVSTTDIYNIAVDFENKTISVEPAVIYGIGNCFGAWDAKVFEFTVSGSHATIIAPNAGDLRMYAESAYYNTDWWRQEFNIYDGKIVFRGDGGDQPAVPVSAGQQIDLDLSNQTGTIQ